MVTIVVKSIKAQRIVLGKMSSNGTSGDKLRKASGSLSQRSSWDFGWLWPMSLNWPYIWLWIPATNQHQNLNICVYKGCKGTLSILWLQDTPWKPHAKGTAAALWCYWEAGGGFFKSICVAGHHPDMPFQGTGNLVPAFTLWFLVTTGEIICFTTDSWLWYLAPFHAQKQQ